MNISNIILKKLKQNNTKVIFEYPGGNIAPILDEIKRDGNIDLIVTRNDQAASLMADAYARTTGEVGVCMATVGPGATNLITGIANAYCDSIPIVAITGQTGTGSLKKEKKIRQLGFQEIDIVSVVKPITKWSYMIEDVNEIEKVMDKAFRIAKSGRPGPVLIDIPIDIQRTEMDEKELNYNEEIDEVNNKRIINKEKIDLLIEQLNRSKRPVIIAGGGVILSNAQKELDILSKRLVIPVADTLMGQGSFNQDSELSLEFMGCYGSRACNKAIAEADLIIGLGNRFDVRSIGSELDSFQKDKYIVHIDIDEHELNNRVKVDLDINNDVKEVLKYINSKSEQINISNGTKEWITHIKYLKDKFSLEKDYALETNYEKVRPQYIINKISELTDGKAIITSDVGQNQMWTAQFYKFKYPRTNLTSGGLGNMGYGLPAAIAAKYAKNGLQAINITGDGSFQMNLQELATAIQYKLPVKVFIMHNKTLGLVKQFQDKTFIGKATSTIIEYNPDFAKIAEAYGAKGFEIKTTDEIDNIVKQALEYNGTVVVDCYIDSDELAIPELEGGHYLDNQYPYNINDK
jgi:acetolactate synthase-1/2/3 large subunit